MSEFMKAALLEAEEGVKNKHGGPFGAVVVLNGKIIGRGHNRVVSSLDPTAHGEITAIRDACKNIGSFDLSGAELYTTCYPCPMCLGAILWARIKKVHYCFDSNDAANVGFDDSNFYNVFREPEAIKALAVHEPAEAARCAEIFAVYNADAEKKLY